MCWSRSWVRPAKTAEPIEMLFGAFVNISVPVCVYIGWWRHRIHGHDMIAILWVWNVVMSGAKIYHVIRIKLRHCHVYAQRETDWWLFCDAPSVFSRERSTNDSVTVTVSGIQYLYLWWLPMFTELHLHHFRVKCNQYSSISVIYTYIGWQRRTFVAHLW